MALDQIRTGVLKEAERNLRRGIKLSREIENSLREAIDHQEFGRVLSYRGEWQEAEQELGLSLKYDTKQNDYQGLSLDWSYHALRFLFMVRQNPKSRAVNLKISIESAERALELADVQAKKLPVARDYVRGYSLLGAAHRANGDLDRAEEALAKAINICRQINNVESEADILLELAKLSYARSDFKDAKEKAEEALLITERSGFVLQGADVNLFIAQYALEHEKDKVKAKEYAEEAKKLAICDGPPYYYKVAYDEAERFLENLK